MSEIKVSINVAVYNTSKYLRQCLDSLVGQTLQEIEIILVNDGSTDDSGVICDEYAAQDSRIKVIHKPNGGSGSARQEGLQHCKGEYIIYCDSDDWVEPDMYEKMYQLAQAKDCDVVMCAFYYNYPNGKQVEVNVQPQGLGQVELIKQALTHRLSPSCCNKLWRRKFFEQHQLSWEQGINQGEDGLMLLKQLQYPITMYYLPSPLYHYRRDIDGESYTNNLRLETFQQLEYINQWKSDHLSKDLYHRELFIARVSFLCFGFRVKDMPKGYHEALISKLFSIGDVWRYQYWTSKSILLLLATISYPLARCLFRVLYKLFYR